MKKDPIILADGLILPAEDFTRPNDNVLIVGPSGTGKSLSVLLPNLVNSENTNPVASYAKEYDAECMQRFLASKGYENDTINLIHVEKSTVMPDPLNSIESYEDISALSAAIVNGTITKTADDYWTLKAMTLLNSLIAAVFMVSEDNHEPSMLDVLELFDKLLPEEDGHSVKTDLDPLFFHLEKASPRCYAVREYKSVASLPYRTFACVRDTLSASLSIAFPETVRRVLRSKSNPFDVIDFANGKKSLIIISSGVDRSMEYYANLVYREILRGLLRYAASCPDGCLPRAVRFYFDDFAANAPIRDLPQQLCIVRSAGISVLMLLQSESSLETIYQSDADVIRANISCYCYFSGGMDNRSVEIAAKKFDLPYNEILTAPTGKIFILTSGQKPLCLPRFNTLESKEYQEYLKVSSVNRRGSSRG